MRLHIGLIQFNKSSCQWGNLCVFYPGDSFRQIVYSLNIVYFQCLLRHLNIFLNTRYYSPVDQRDPAVLLATVWPEPFAYGTADPETMKSREFEFSAEGLAAAAAWLNGQVDESGE